MPSDNGKCQDMEVNTRRLNRRNVILSSEKTVERTRSLCSRKFLSEIISHIQSNSEVRIENPNALEALTCEVNKLCQSSKEQRIKPEVDVIEKNCKTSPENHIMKFGKKTDPLPKVSDSFPKTPGVLRRTAKRDYLKHETAVDVKNIPLPDEKPPFHGHKSSETTARQPSSNRKVVFSRSETEKFIEKSSSFPGRVILKKDSSISIMTENPPYIPSNGQCSVSTSPVSSCESLESGHVQSSKCAESPENFIARKVKESLYESSLVDQESTSETCHTNHIEDVVVIREVPVSYKWLNEETSHPNFSQANYSYPTVQFRHNENRSETPLSSKSMTYVDEKPIETIQCRNVRTPPPTGEGSWRTPVRYRDLPPGKERRSRFSVRDQPWAYHDKCRFNQAGRTPSQEDRNRMTSRNTTGGLNWRNSQESIKQEFSNDVTSANFMNEMHRRNLEVPSPQTPRYDQTRANLLRDARFRRSYETLPQEPKFKETMTKAPSLLNINIRSLESDRTIEQPFLFHLSPDMIHQPRPWQQYCGATYSAGLGYDGNFNGSSPITPNYSYTPPILDSSLSYLPKQEADDPLEPNMRGHQLLGDSQLLRFSRQILGKYSRSNGSLRYLGLCVSGQTIQELHHKIKEKFYPVGENIVLLIGTNNFLQNDSLDDMMSAWDALMSHLLSVPTRRLLLLTVPPIPKLAGLESHWDRLDKFNRFIQGYATGSGRSGDDVRVADISKLFLDEHQKCREDCFELMYTESQRTDLVHLNNRGFGLIRDFLVGSNFL